MKLRNDNEGERRLRPRYSLEAALEWVIQGRRAATGRGTTINLSSGGALFRSDQAVAEGMPIELGIELAIAWPARLNDVTGLTLLVKGRTVRIQGKCVAVKILRREFRTRPVAGQPVVPLRTRC